MPIDKRQRAVDALMKKIKAGKRLSEKDVRETLYLARDYALLYMATELVSGKIIEKARVRVYNALQNAVERHETMHPAERNAEPITIGYELKLPDRGDSEEIEA
jgi:hypothetical protein